MTFFFNKISWFMVSNAFVSSQLKDWNQNLSGTKDMHLSKVSYEIPIGIYYRIFEKLQI